MPITQLQILLVEDEEDDVFFVQRAAENSELVARFHHVPNGAEAIKYLKREGPYADRQKYFMPNLILLDLKMPIVNGFELLEWLGSHPECAIVPVIVYTGSDWPTDARKAYRLGANACFIKPSDPEKLSEFLLFAYEFWSRCVCHSPAEG